MIFENMMGILTDMKHVLGDISERKSNFPRSCFCRESEGQDDVGHPLTNLLNQVEHDRTLENSDQCMNPHDFNKDLYLAVAIHVCCPTSLKEESALIALRLMKFLAFLPPPELNQSHQVQVE